MTSNQADPLAVISVLDPIYVDIQQSSGDPAYDTSVLRAVQHANPLPPPPSRYQKEFSEVIVDLHSEEQGG